MPATIRARHAADTVLRRFDCVLAPSKAKVLAEFEKRKGGKLEVDELDSNLNQAAGQRFHNHAPLDFEKLKGDPDNIEKHLVAYIKGFSKNECELFDFFEFETELERMHEANNSTWSSPQSPVPRRARRIPSCAVMTAIY